MTHSVLSHLISRPVWRRLAPVKPVIAAITVLAILALAWTATSHLLAEVSYNDLSRALSVTPAMAILAAIALTALSFAALTVYDITALALIGRKLPTPIVALASFCAYAVGNTVGFGPLTAGAIRYRFYTPLGVEPDELARIVALVTATFGLGVMGVAGIGLMASDLSKLPLPDVVGRVAGALLVMGLAGLWFAAGSGRSLTIAGRTINLPSRRALTQQFLAAIIDISAAAAVLWVLLPADTIGLPAFIAIYAVAIGVGVLSHVPAGLGVFEAIIMSALAGLADPDALLAALLLYRLIYHLLPLALSVLVVVGAEAHRTARNPTTAALLRTMTRLAPAVLGAFTLVVGAIQIFSGMTPLSEASLDAGVPLPLPVIEGAHFLSSVLGVWFLFIARGLVHRLDGAWLAAMLLLPIAILLALLKPFALGEAVLLLILLAALATSRVEFSRHASLMHGILTIRWLTAIGVLVATAIALLLFVYKDVDYATRLWWQFELSDSAPRSLRAMLGVVLAGGFIAAWSLLRPAATASSLPSADDLARAEAIAASQPRAEARLVTLGDKSLLFSDDGLAFIMYARQGRSWVCLSDPIGPRESWPALIWQFVEMAHMAGGRAAFYQVAADNLSHYADAGLRAYKLGEEARVNLQSFDLKGPKRGNQRNALNRASREGSEFAILPPGAALAHMDELSAISQGWLAEHNVREKRFSLGAFRPDYIASQPVAVIRRDGRIIAFASLLLTDEKVEASIDLMRFSGAPAGTMEILILRLIQHFQAEGYQWFCLGMAPLSGLPETGAAGPLWYHVGRSVFENGEKFYNFSGLRAFKSKFGPEWRPRYLALSGGADPILTLADIAVLISGGIKGVIGR